MDFGGLIPIRKQSACLYQVMMRALLYLGSYEMRFVRSYNKINKQSQRHLSGMMRE